MSSVTQLYPALKRWANMQCACGAGEGRQFEVPVRKELPTPDIAGINLTAILIRQGNNGIFFPPVRY